LLQFIKAGKTTFEHSTLMATANFFHKCVLFTSCWNSCKLLLLSYLLIAM